MCRVLMDAEVRNEGRSTVASDGRGPESTQFPFYAKPTRVRVSELCQTAAPSYRPPSAPSPDGLNSAMIYPVPGEELTRAGTGSGPGGGCCSPGSEGPESRTSPSTAAPDGPSGFPPLPPPPLFPGSGVHGSVDESDQQDGAEYEEEEAVFSLSAPPTNQ